MQRLHTIKGEDCYYSNLPLDFDPNRSEVVVLNNAEYLKLLELEKPVEAEVKECPECNNMNLDEQGKCSFCESRQPEKPLEDWEQSKAEVLKQYPDAHASDSAALGLPAIYMRYGQRIEEILDSGRTEKQAWINAVKKLRESKESPEQIDSILERYWEHFMRMLVGKLDTSFSEGNKPMAEWFTYEIGIGLDNAQK